MVAFFLSTAAGLLTPPPRAMTSGLLPLGRLGLSSWASVAPKTYQAEPGRIAPMLNGSAAYAAGAATRVDAASRRAAMRPLKRILFLSMGFLSLVWVPL